MPYNRDFIKECLKQIIDELNRFLIIIFLILLVIALFIRNFYLDLAKFFVFFLILFRLFSKNKIKRKNENKLYLKIKDNLLKPFANIIRNFKNKNYVYKKCCSCKTILKLPLPPKVGIQHAKCPNCGHRVTLFTLKKMKIEIIKEKKKYER